MPGLKPAPRNGGNLLIRDYRDDALEHFALDEIELLRRVESLGADVMSYRELALAGISALRDKTVCCDRLRDQYFRLLDEYRRLREQIIRESE